MTVYVIILYFSLKAMIKLMIFTPNSKRFLVSYLDQIIVASFLAGCYCESTLGQSALRYNVSEIRMIIEKLFQYFK